MRLEGVTFELNSARLTPDATQTLRSVADALRGGIMKCYYLDVRRLRRRLTFEGVDVLLQELETKLYNNLFIPGYKSNLGSEEILQTLGENNRIMNEVLATFSPR